MTQLNLEHIEALLQELDDHPLYPELREAADLRIFMSHHIYAVWDYMSLIKNLQRHLAPATVPWMPEEHPTYRRYVNLLVLHEESDQAPAGISRLPYMSHLALYLAAMEELGADTARPRQFFDRMRREGVEEALESGLIPEPARRFAATTFCLIGEDRPLLVVAALTWGRARVIPQMCRHLLSHMELRREQAPALYHYLERHIELYGQSGDLGSTRLLEHLCGDDPTRLEEAEAAAEEAICARIRLWDGIHDAILAARG
jgi:hypothetical protein